MQLAQLKHIMYILYTVKKQMHTHFKSKLVESEETEIGYAYGLILNFGSGQGSIFGRIQEKSDPDRDLWRALHNIQ